jgi:hypothetical protein
MTLMSDDINAPCGPKDWHRSSFCADGGCIDVRQLADAPHDLILMKSSVKIDGHSRIFVTSKAEFTAFILGVKNGEFDELVES